MHIPTEARGDVQEAAIVRVGVDEAGGGISLPRAEFRAKAEPAALRLSAISYDAENDWEWIIGELDGVEVDLTRRHKLPRFETDIRIFRLDQREFTAEQRDLARLRPLALGSIKYGRWIYRSGNDFEMVVTDE
jgi:hypothetical protein